MSLFSFNRTCFLISSTVGAWMLFLRFKNCGMELLVSREMSLICAGDLDSKAGLSWPMKPLSLVTLATTIAAPCPFYLRIGTICKNSLLLLYVPAFVFIPTFWSSCKFYVAGTLPSTGLISRLSATPWSLGRVEWLPILIPINVFMLESFGMLPNIILSIFTSLIPARVFTAAG